MSIIGKQGRIATAKAIKVQPLHIAWGPGDGTWVSPPPEDNEATELTNEIGRRTAVARFVTPDPDGQLEAPGGATYSYTETPTNILSVSAQFRFTDAPAAVIRQVGVFIGSEIIAGLPAGQQYFAPAEIESKGDLLQIQNRQPLQRSADMRTKINIILEF